MVFPSPRKCYINLRQGSTSSARPCDTLILHAPKLPVTSVKNIPLQLLLPQDALIPQLTLKLMTNSQPGRNFKVNRLLIQYLLRQLWLLKREHVVLNAKGLNWLYGLEPLMLLLALLRLFMYPKITLMLLQHCLQRGNTWQEAKPLPPLHLVEQGSQVNLSKVPPRLTPRFRAA